MNKLNGSDKPTLKEKVKSIAGIITCSLVLAGAGHQAYEIIQDEKAADSVVSVNEEYTPVNTVAAQEVKEEDKEAYKLIEESFMVIGYDQESGMYEGESLEGEGSLYFKDYQVKDTESINIDDTVKAVYLDDNQEEKLFLFVYKYDNKMISRLYEDEPAKEEVKYNTAYDERFKDIIEEDTSVKGYSEGAYIVSSVKGNEYYALTPQGNDGMSGVMFTGEQIIGEVKEGNKVVVKFMDDEIISVQAVNDDVYVMAEDGSYVNGEEYY